MINQLRVYQINPDLKEQFDQRFREHALRIMKSYNFDVRAMWYSTIGDQLEFIYILEWPDKDTMQRQWDAFMADKEWGVIKTQSREKYGEIVISKKCDQILHTTDWFNNSL